MEFKLTTPCFIKRKQDLKFIMRAFILLFCTSVFSFSSGDLLSQNSKIVIDTDTILTIDEVFDIIYKQTDYSFAYKSEIFKDVPSIELKKGSIKTNDLLNQILSKGNFNVVFGTNNTILIKEKEIDIKIEQGFQVSGIVTDFNGQSLAGANVLEKGTINGVQTDFNGKFSLNVTDQEAVLEISYLGFVTIEVLVDGQDNFSIVLQEDSEKLDEIVVVGYGIQRKKDLTGSISTVDGEVLSKRNVTQLSQALQGTMPGMMVTRSSDEPGESASVRVRGITTIGDNSPLFIVDGVPIDNINYVNPSNIESITVLKDAASASIYGARAAAGVILITTKRAKEGQINLEYTSNIGFDKPTAFIEKVGPQRYLEMINEWVWNDAGNTPGQEYALYAQEEVDNWISNNQSNPNQYPITDWQSLLLKRQANRQSHELVISAGGEKVNTRASVKYEDIGALYNHRSFTRILTRVNNSIEITDNLSAEVDFSHNYTHNTEPMVNPVWNALSYAPIYAAQWDDGRIAGGKNGDNAYAMLNYGGNDDYWVNNINGRLGLTFKPTKNLSFTARVAPNLKSTKYKTFRKQIEYYSENDPTQFGGFISGFNATNLSERRVDSYNLTKQFLVNYEKSFNVHNVNTMIGYEDFYAFNESVGAIGRNFELNSYPYLDLAPVDFITASGYANENSYRSFFGRATYDYKSKYFIQGNLRLDGSSRFHQDYRWGYFPSVSAGWAISEESFMQNLTSISFLKIRGSWGNMGNERIGNYPYQSNINFSNGLFYQGNDVVSATTAAQVDYAIQDISWETTETFDVGLDLQLFKNKFTLNADYYKKTTKGMLLDLEIPDYIGFSNPTQNAGEMYTTGWDFNVSWKEVVNDLSYTISLNLSDSKTKMGGLSGIVFDGSTIIREGSEFNEWYGYKSDGIFQTQEEVDNSALLNSSVQPGDIKYLDVSGPDGEPDGVISPDYDRVLLGGSLPRYLYGGTIDLNYKGFDFSLAVQGVGMQNSYLNSNLTKPFVGQWHNVSKIVDGNYWSHYNTPEENLKATYPRLSYTSESANYSTSDFWLINGAYFRLKNIVLGYTFPESTFSQVKLKSIRVYGSVNDLFTISHFPDGWDPESAYDSLINTTINLGISVKF